MTLHIFSGQHDDVAKWVGARIKHCLPPVAGFATLGIAKEQDLVAGIVYTNYRQNDIEAWCAVDDGFKGRWLNKAILKSMFDYPFANLGCTRITLLISKANKKSRNFAEKLGFKLEGKARCAYPDGKDCMIYGMLKKECRWI